MSPTRVVNIRLESADVYVGRAGRGEKGTHGNPYTIGVGQSRGASLKLYRTNFEFKVKHDKAYVAEMTKLIALRRRNGSLTLGCFCAPKGGLTVRDVPFICHGQIIAEYIDEHT